MELFGDVSCTIETNMASVKNIFEACRDVMKPMMTPSLQNVDLGVCSRLNKHFVCFAIVSKIRFIEICQVN